MFGLDNKMLSCYSVNECRAKANEYKDNFDVVFMVDHANYDEDTLDMYNCKIAETAEAIWAVSPNVSITIYTFNGYSTADFQKYGEYHSASELQNGLNRATSPSIYHSVNLSAPVDDMVNNYANKKIYAFMFFDSQKANYMQASGTGLSTLYGIKYGGKNINISVISYPPNNPVTTQNIKAMLK